MTRESVLDEIETLSGWDLLAAACLLIGQPPDDLTVEYLEEWFDRLSVDGLLELRDLAVGRLQ